MKAKILVLSLVSITAFAASQLTPEQEKIEEQKRMKALSDLGLPLPGSGIKLVPRSTLDLSEDQLKKGAKAEEEMKTLGYAVLDTNRPQELLNFHNYSKTQFKLYAGNDRATSTHLRQQIKDLKLAFNFKGVPQGNTLAAAGNITLLGVAPQGGFHEDKGGWSGAAQYFDAKSIGSCSYGVMNVKASNTAAELAIEDVTYSVNNKATIITVEGNNASGFLYKVDWYDDKNFHELECANMKYSADKTNSVIALANQIEALMFPSL